MKSFFSKYWPLLIIILINLVFFIRLFYPETKLFVTPDFGLSDLTHFNFPLRKIFAESIKNHTLPLWETKTGSGLPLFAEGQAGIFNIVNLFTSYFFPLAIGFNLTYLVSYLLMGVATFLFCRLIKLTKSASLLAAIVFSFCGYNITHFAHTHHIVTAAFLPVMFFVLEKALRTKRKIWWVILAIAASQALLGGNVQVAVYSFISLGFYFVFRLFTSEVSLSPLKRGNSSTSEVAFFILTFILAFTLSAVQLLPSLELSSTSFRQGGLPEQELKQFPYPIKHLLTFLNPYLLGDPHKATYPMYGEDWGLFWENTAYIGIVPLLLALVAVISVFLGRRYKGERRDREIRQGRIRDEMVVFWFFFAIFTLLLSLGKYTPLFAILKLPPLNLFRIPSTFLFITDFALAMLAGYGLEALRNFQFSRLAVGQAIFNFQFSTLIVHCSLFIVSFLDLMIFGYNYNPIGKAEDWEKEPQVVEFLKQDTTNYRIYDLLSAVPWNNRFSDYGWEGDASEYLRFREGLKPDINLSWDIPSVNSYLGFEPERLSHWKMLIDQTILFHQEKKEIYFTKQSQDLFNVQGVKYFVTPFPIISSEVKLVFQTDYKSGQNYFVYENIKVLPRARVVYDFVVKETLKDIDRMFFSGTLNLETQVILESPLALENETDVSSAEIEIVKENNRYLKLKVNSPATGIFVLADTFYPGWTAKVNNKVTEILPANLTQRAVLVLAGASTVEFSYQPSSFKTGAMISAGALILTIGLFVFLLLPKK